MAEDGMPVTNGAPAPTERSLAQLRVSAVPPAARITHAVVEASASELGLTGDKASHLAEASAAVCRAIYLRGFDDPDGAVIDIEVVRVGHRVLIRLDDLGLPFNYDDEEALDGTVLRRSLEAGWVDEIHHSWRGRQGNRTVLVRHVEPASDLRVEPLRDAGPPPDADADGNDAVTRLGAPQDADAICRLAWRTYGATYQHDEYYQPDRLASMLADSTQVSFITAVESGEIIGHSALLVDEPGAVVVEAGRAMVDPRFRGHHLMHRPQELRERWFADHGVLAMAGAAVTAHTRSQGDGPVASVQLGFMPPIVFEGIGDTATNLREAVLGGFVPMAEIPAQVVHAPVRDAAMLERLYGWLALDRTVETASVSEAPTAPTSTIEVSVRADLGHAVVSVRSIGLDLPEQLHHRLRSIRAGGVDVVYVDVGLDEPTASWAADVAVAAGAIFAGVLPLHRRGVDVVRYQLLGETAIDPDAIHIKAEPARELLQYVLAQRGDDA